ncbi:unnamed protein product [Dimorphilus gyrociliatus]|uniref:Uncharacterized protein n=1 Tax=Dimorphilus gyrociliatus TaxID=2664684 RepID=A0A7I8W7C7_9ANNE|nr:unnamed protein product [Dimorphilus gyrociliatus]
MEGNNEESFIDLFWSTKIRMLEIIKDNLELKNELYSLKVDFLTILENLDVVSDNKIDGFAHSTPISEEEKFRRGLRRQRASIRLQRVNKKKNFLLSKNRKILRTVSESELEASSINCSTAVFTNSSDGELESTYETGPNFNLDTSSSYKESDAESRRQLSVMRQINSLIKAGSSGKTKGPKAPANSPRSTDPSSSSKQTTPDKPFINSTPDTLVRTVIRRKKRIRGTVLEF